MVAHALRLSIVEFLSLTRLTGLDPFQSLDFYDIYHTGAPVQPAIWFIHLVQTLTESSLKPVQALYLIWNEDISGKSAPSDSTITSLARTLRDNFAAIEAEYSLIDDPNGDITKSRMALVYDTATTDFFFGLLDNTVETVIAYPNPVYPSPQPPPAQAILEAASGHLSYDDLRKQLKYTGVLDSPALVTIHNAIRSNGDYPALHKAVEDLSAANHMLVDRFFKMYPALLTLYQNYVASNEPPQKKRAALLHGLLDDLKEQRKKAQALATITAAADTDPSFASALLDDPTVLHASRAEPQCQPSKTCST